jgi:hypothetical protein
MVLTNPNITSFEEFVDIKKKHAKTRLPPASPAAARAQAWAAEGAARARAHILSEAASAAKRKGK